LVALAFHRIGELLLIDGMQKDVVVGSTEAASTLIESSVYDASAIEKLHSGHNSVSDETELQQRRVWITTTPREALFALSAV
jgi:hypothetical protein